RHRRRPRGLSRSGDHRLGRGARRRRRGQGHPPRRRPRRSGRRGASGRHRLDRSGGRPFRGHDPPAAHRLFLHRFGRSGGVEAGASPNLTFTFRCIALGPKPDDALAYKEKRMSAKLLIALAAVFSGVCGYASGQAPRPPMLDPTITVPLDPADWIRPDDLEARFRWDVLCRVADGLVPWFPEGSERRSGDSVRIEAAMADT